MNDHISNIIKNIAFGFIFYNIYSCALFSNNNRKLNLSSLKNKETKVYQLNDKSGQFKLFREKGISKNKSQFVVKKKIIEVNENLSVGNILEQSISISTFGKHSSNIPILLPTISEYKIWFDKKKYISKIKYISEKKILEVSLISPENKWNGIKEYPLPTGENLVYCYLSQIIECAGQTGFIEKAVNKGRGTMNFYLLLEGFPYMSEQYINLPNHPFVKAKLGYDGQNSLGEKRFKLIFNEQSILIFIDEKLNFKKMFWPSQGLSIRGFGK